MEHYKLRNGIRVLLQPGTSVAEVSVEFWIGTGAKDGTEDKFGFAHFFEHATHPVLKSFSKFNRIY